MQADIKSVLYLGQCFAGFWYEHICATVVSHVMALTVRRNYSECRSTAYNESFHTKCYIIYNYSVTLLSD